jgi:hypothetical protein
VGAGTSASNERNITVIFFIIITVYFTGEIETLPGLRNSYSTESLAQVEFCARRNSIYTCIHIHIYVPLEIRNTIR